MLTKLSQQFRTFAKNECQNSSPLYEHLAYKISEDKELLNLASCVPQGQPVPNLLLAAVHYLLSSFKDPLAHYYPSFTASTKPINGVYPVFKAYVLAHTDELKVILQEKLVQTNEIHRCAYLYPMMTDIYLQLHQDFIHQAEISTVRTMNQPDGHARWFKWSNN